MIFYIFLLLTIPLYSMEQGNYTQLDDANSQSYATAIIHPQNSYITPTLHALQLGLPYLQRWKENKDNPLEDAWNKKFISNLTKGIISLTSSKSPPKIAASDAMIIKQINMIYQKALEGNPLTITNEPLVLEIEALYTLLHTIKPSQSELIQSPRSKFFSYCCNSIVIVCGIGLYIGILSLSKSSTFNS